MSRFKDKSLKTNSRIIYFEFNDEDAEIIVTKNKKSDYFYLNAI